MASGVQVPTEAYVTLEDVLELLPNRTYTQSSKPTVEQCERIMKRVAKVINARLRALGYSPPLTNTDDVEVLSQINALGAAVLIECATLVGVQGDSPLVDKYQEQYDNLMKDLSAGKFTFSGAGDIPSSEADGPDELDASGSRTEPLFVNSSDERKTQF